MNRQQLIARLEYFLNPANGIGAVLYFVVNVNGESVIRFADIEERAKQELKDRFLEYISEKFITNEELHYLSISEADDLKNVIYRYDIEERPESLNILNEILVNAEKEHFQFDQNSFDDVQGYLITIGNEANKIALYKKHHPVNLLRQDRFLLIPSNERLVKVQNDALAIDKSFDFMMVDDNLIVLKLNTLERFFGFEQVVRNRAQGTIAIVQANQILEDIEQLNDLAQNMSNARKLMRIRNSPVLSIPTANVLNSLGIIPN